MAERDGAIEGGKETPGRLSESLDRSFLITHIFNAPRPLVWQAWTEPRHMARWWGPRSATNSVCNLDVRPGGAYRIVMRGADGVDYPLKGVFREVVPPARLVMTMDCSEHSAEWHDMVNPNRDRNREPRLELLMMVIFEEREAATRLTIRMHFESPEIRDGMVKAGMHEGWSQSLERLAELLAKM